MEDIWRHIPRDIFDHIIQFTNINTRVALRSRKRVKLDPKLLYIFREKFDTIPKIKCDSNNGWFDEAIWVVLQITDEKLYYITHDGEIQHVALDADAQIFNKGTTDDLWEAEDAAAILEDYNASHSYEEGTKNRRSLSLPKNANIATYVGDLFLAGHSIGQFLV